MLVIRTPNSIIAETVWYVNDNRPAINFHDVEEIQANGHELHHIYRRFENIPATVGVSVVHWYGDTAKFIVSNL